jgi:CheY-like chemotaxis protein
MRVESRGVTILLVDDDEDDRLLTADALRESHVAEQVTNLCDGVELMDYLKHRGRYAPPASPLWPSLVLLDLNMPRKDGREALREIKSDPNLRSIPVIVLTTSRAESDIKHSYDLGANSFIVKPSTFEELVEVLRITSEYWLRTVELPRLTSMTEFGRR